MGKAKNYIQRVRQAHQEVQDAQDKLESWTGDEYPEHLNEDVWQAVEHRNRVIRGKDQ